MPITNCHETSRKATQLLTTAIQEEANGQWFKAIDMYRQLIALVAPDNLPTTFTPTDNYRIMLHEAYYSLACAYHKVQEHRLALHNFSQAIEVFNKTKAGRSLGYRSPEWMLVPALCKRALSHGILGDYKSAVKDVTQAAQLDIDNVDILCCQVLLHNTFNEYEKAMKLLVKGLNVNKSHEGCHLLRASLKSQGHPPVVKQNQREGVTDVATLYHPNITQFVDLYLRTLAVPHTQLIIDITFPPPPGKVDKMAADTKFDMSWKKHSLNVIRPFKCGALPALFERDPVREEEAHIDKHRRRDQYSGNLKEQARRMKFLTQEQFAGLLEKNQSRKKMLEWRIKHEQNRKVGDKITISAFRPINTQEVPRLYNKPWLGDRLQSAPLPQRVEQPIFYPSYS